MKSGVFLTIFSVIVFVSLPLFAEATMASTNFILSGGTFGSGGGRMESPLFSVEGIGGQGILEPRFTPTAESSFFASPSSGSLQLTPAAGGGGDFSLAPGLAPTTPPPPITPITPPSPDNNNQSSVSPPTGAANTGESGIVPPQNQQAAALFDVEAVAGSSGDSPRPIQIILIVSGFILAGLVFFGRLPFSVQNHT